MENENLDLDAKPAGNKDLWLFLIIVDIVLLCVFGFFLYKHFSAYLFAIRPAPVQETTAPAQEPAQVTVLEEVVSVTEEAKTEPAQPAQEVKPTETLVAEIIAAEEVPAEKPAAKTQTPADKKVSVVIAKNPKSKYRRVTFKWYGEGKKVQIVSGFTMSKPQNLAKKNGHWETTLSILPGTYKFLYVIDGENRQDPYSPSKDGRSVVVID